MKYTLLNVALLAFFFSIYTQSLAQSPESNQEAQTESLVDTNPVDEESPKIPIAEANGPALDEIPTSSSDAALTTASEEAIAETESSMAETSIAEPVIAEQADAIQQQVFHVIIGSFSDFSNAKKRTAELEDQGLMAPSIIQSDKGVYRVSYIRFYSKDEAYQESARLKEKFDIGSWVLIEDSSNRAQELYKDPNPQPAKPAFKPKPKKKQRPVNNSQPKETQEEDNTYLNEFGF